MDTPDNSFLYSVDNHNIANGDDSWISKKISATGELIGDVGEALTYGAVGAVVAGVNSILNTGIAVGNFLGTDIAPISTYETLKSMDDDLGLYYKQHEAGVETAGFLIGALVPGTAGVKALQAAKAGYLGENMLRSGGLMKTLTADYAAAAKATYAAGNAPFSLIEANALKSLAQGFGSNVLDAAAFNTAVTASMFASPMLSQQSISDLFWDDVTGSLLWGGVGGVITGVKKSFDILKAGRTVKEMTLPQNFITDISDKENVQPILKVLTYFKNKFDLPEAIGPLKVDTKATGLTGQDVLQIASANREKTLSRVDELIRGSLNEFAGNDVKIGNALFEATKDATKFEDILQSLGPLAKQASRISGDDSLVYGDVHFPVHGKGWDDFQSLIAEGRYDDLFSPKGGKDSAGFRISGDLSELKVTGAKSGGAISAGSKQVAWDQGYDVFRNPNGTISINPASKILTRETRLPSSTRILIDLEDGGTVKFKATPGLADLSTPAKGITINGDTVIAGNLNPIKMKASKDYNPLEGSYLEAQARNIWAHNAEISWQGMRIGENDLPLLERLYVENPKAETSIYLNTGNTSIAAPRGEVLRNLIEQKKSNFAKLADLGKMPVDEMSLRLNATDKYLTQGDGDGWIKLQKGVDYNQPRYAKVEYSEEVTGMPMLNPNNHTGALEYARQIEANTKRVKENFANFAKAFSELFPDGVSPYDAKWNTASDGAGAGLASFANANYGTFGGWAQYVGSLVDKLLLERKTVTAKGLNGSFAKLAQDSEGITGQAKMAEAALINNRLLQSSDAWLFHPDQPTTLVTRSDLAQMYSKDKAGNVTRTKFEPDNVIEMKSTDVADFWRTHSGFNGERQTHVANMKGASGVGDDFNPGVIYPVPVDTKNLSHFVLVEPKSPVTMADKKRIISAKDEATLQKLIGQVDQSQFRVYTKQESENWHKAIGDYEFALGLNDSAVDSSLKREGLLSQHFPTINEGFAQRVEEWHMRQEELLTRSMVYHRYSQEFEELKHLGEKYTNLATSQFKYLSTTLEKSVKDPYNDIIRAALNVSRSSEYQPWVNFNNFVKDAIEKPINKLRDIFKTQPVINDEFVKTVGGIMEDMGQRPVFENTASIMIANKNIPDKPWLGAAISKAQAVMSTTLLQWDSMNAINNMIGSAVLTGPELKYIMKGIQEQNPAVAGKMAEYMRVVSPDGSGIAMPTIQRLLSNAVKNYSAEDATHLPLLERYRSIGTVTDLSLQARESFNRLLIDWSKVGQNEALSNIEKAAEFGRKWSGNQRAEEFNRFVASDVMRQVTDFGVEAGVMSAKEANEYIQIFVNRTQGNYLYSQRPIVFQGVVGQAVSLFQTYQFNLMQQMFRFVGEGESKTASMLLGLQGSIYGMQGLPAFNFLNTHIVGNSSGNTQHRDLYTASYSVFGKSLGDWMLYGAGSNAFGLVDPSMKFNLYSRGDINPRQLTVLPTNISDIPIVAASTKFVGNLFAASEKISQGAAFWPTVSQALEHNGLSRPLAGLAQIAQGYTTTNAGSLLSSSQDFGSVATLTRLAGAKPFDEAVALDALYRINAYRAHDSKNIAELGSAIKTTVVANAQPTQDQVTNFSKEYAKAGGKIENFNRFFSNEMLNANRSQVNKIVTNLNSPFAKQMQTIMGGTPLPDFTSPTPQ